MSRSAPKGIAAQFDQIRADYDMSRASRFIRRRTGVAPQGAGGDYHYRSEPKYYADIEQARDMDRNDGLVGVLADRRVDNIVQGGFALDTKTGDKGLDLDLWNRWEAYSTDADQCDIAGELCWHEIERLACRAESIDGDIVVTGTEDGPLQTIESHAIQTSTKIENTFLGVTRNKYGKREQYHVRYDMNEFGGKTESEPIDVRNEDGIRQLFHVYNPKRVNVTRGVTQLAPIFALSGMLEDINFAKLVQQQVVSCFAVLRTVAAGTEDLPSVDNGYGEPSTETTSSGTRLLEGIAPGMEITGRPGESLEMDSPSVPNSEYFQQVKLILQIIGVNFGLPLCLVLMDGSETNFSGWRGAVDEARKGFVADQMNLVRRLHKPAYEWWLHRELEMEPSLRNWEGKTGINIFGHKWNLPTWSYIEPVADSEGDASQIRNGQTSPRRMQAARGKDHETIVDETVEDNAYAITKAQQQADKINAEFPKAPPLSWRDLVPMPMPEGQTIALQDPAAVAAQDKAAADTKTKPVAKKKDDPTATFCPTGPGGGTDNSCGGESGGGKTRTKAKPMSGKAARAKEAHVMVDKAVQQEADVAERAMAKSLKGASFKNSEPVDIVVAGPDGAIEHGIEHKYMFANANAKITMNKYAQVRKVEWEKKNKATFHTVVESKDGDIYYRRGVGSFRVGGMHKVAGGKKELAKLLKTADDKLPAGAQRTDAAIRSGSWKPAKDGRGYVNSKSGEVVRPKK